MPPPACDAGIPSYTEVEVAVAARTSVGTGPMSMSVSETTFESGE